ncbi:type II toxin-antitoxin system VapB family antitoxin [Faunimonas sp. B44]|uniref:type II toxin-antitoxin system VapB family antitoxin n=1 Tax=Faunimonas sp. B44 TaxID=3461493 RepID=UPI004044E50F
MAIHVRDPETDSLVRRLARRKGVGLTDAIREAVANELEREEKALSLWDRTADIRADIASWPRTGLQADKAFYDSLYDREDH